MSDRQVRAALERMETWLTDPLWRPEAESLATWDLQLKAAAAAAERGPEWAELAAWAQSLATRLEARTRVLEAKQNEIRQELNAQVLGKRALKGYRPGP